MSHLVQVGYAPKTIDHIRDVLSAILRTAVRCLTVREAVYEGTFSSPKTEAGVRKPISPNHVLRRVFPACDALGLPRISWLTFRRPSRLGLAPQVGLVPGPVRGDAGVQRGEAVRTT